MRGRRESAVQEGKAIRQVRWWLVQCYLGFFLFLLGAISSALAGEAGHLISVLGSIEVWRDGRWQPASAGDTLAAGETVRTGDGSRAAILLANGTQLKLNANSRLELKRIITPQQGLLPAAAETLRSVLRILSGEIWVRNSGEPLDIQTVPATASIRGTELTLAVGPSNTARLAVLNGLVEFGNPQGSVQVAANEQATVQLGQAPRKTVLLNPLDAVQWSLYYPGPLNDLAEPVSDPKSPRYWIKAARIYLLRGEVPEAQQALNRALALDPRDAVAYGLRSNIALVQNRKADALADAERAVAADPASSTAYVSLGWVQQAKFDLDGALVTARRAVELDPNNAQALIQESSLLFGMGRLRDAVVVAERARRQAPNDAMVNAIWGFLQLARNQVDDGQAVFQTAIGQDSTLGLPHLGLGLVLFQRNQTEAAVAEIRKAALLEPLVSLYNSYLGKAFYEIKDNQRAKKYLELAKQLDPHDPTPWLYGAIRQQSINRPIEAVESLQKSIDLNDNRGVYRSRLLLDEDLAARAATLGRIYNEVGFTELGLQEGWQSVNRDPTNYSAHRLLSDSYSALPPAEIASVSELLQSQLLQPVNITPIPPQRAETKLLVPNSAITTASLYEFNPLFVRDQLTLLATALGGSQNTWADDLIVSGLADHFSYSLGQSRYQSNGYRQNDDIQNDIYDVFVQAAVSPDFNVQAEYRHRESIQGDLQSAFDGSFTSLRKSIDQDVERLGARYSLSPQTTLLASVIFADRSEAQRYEYPYPITLGVDQSGYQAEAQAIYKGDQFNSISGFRTYSVDYSYSNFIKPEATGEQGIIYSYANIKSPENIIWTLGLSYESDQNLNASLDQINPKFGFQWAINNNISLRAAAFQTVKWDFFPPQTIEPTQIAGFNQFYDDFSYTSSKNYGIALDVQFNSQLFGGLQGLRRDLDIPIGILDIPEFHEIEHSQFDVYNAYLYWLFSKRWAMTASWQYEGFKVHEGLLAEQYFSTPAEMTTISIPLEIKYFDPSGFFANLGAIYVNQHVQYLDKRSLAILPTQGDNFVLVNAGLGYRLPKRWGIVALQGNNLLNKEFHFQDYSFLVSEEIDNPRFIPERSVLARAIINF